MNSQLDEAVMLKPFEILLKPERIAERIREMGRQISNDYAGQAPVLLGVLKGCVVFMADLMRAIDLPLEIEFITAASYRYGSQAADEVVLGGPFALPLKDRHVLIVEAVVDSGRTVKSITKELRSKEPASVEVVTLIDKPGGRRVDIDVKYRGFTVGNEFVIGFGLDNTQQYRNLPFIGRMVEHQ